MLASIRPLPPIPAPQPMPAPAPGPGFNALLQRNRAETRTLPPQPEVDSVAERGDAAPADPASASTPTPSSGVSPPSSKATLRPRMPLPHPSAGASPAQPPVIDADSAPKPASSGPSAPPPDPAIGTWLLSLPDLMPPPPADDLAGEGGGGNGLAPGAPAAPALWQSAPDAPRDTAPRAGGREDVQAKASSIPELISEPTRERALALPDTPAQRDPAQGLLAGSAAPTPRGFDAGSLAPLTLQAPLESPEFAQALGVQISVLARDGVQQAELHLNPAEMGPLSVRIELVGAQAQVDFQADSATTRRVIEAGLPELASALREQGFTLAGGGVFQHAPERREANDDDVGGLRSRRSRGEPEAATAPRRITARVPLGVIDLFA